MMVPYAGRDPQDRPFSNYVPGWKSPGAKHLRGVRMFKAGMDTMQIAERLGVKERTVERWITVERCERLNLPNPYEASA